MKKIIVRGLTAVLVLCLTACGGGNDGSRTPETVPPQAQAGTVLSKKDLLEQAEAVSISDLINDAGTQYSGKILVVEGDIVEISNSSLHIGMFDAAIRVVLSPRELECLQLGQRITVAGKTETAAADDNEGQIVPAVYVMPEAYLVRDTVEWTGEFKGLNGGNDGSYNIKIGDSSTLRRVYFADSFFVPERETVVTVSGKCIDNDLRDAVIVK